MFVVDSVKTSSPGTLGEEENRSGSGEQRIVSVSLKNSMEVFKNIFDPAVDEIVSLMNIGPWRTFVDEGGMYKIEMSHSTSKSVSTGKDSLIESNTASVHSFRENQPNV